jgi:hypothetical protein
MRRSRNSRSRQEGHGPRAAAQACRLEIDEDRTPLEGQLAFESAVEQLERPEVGQLTVADLDVPVRPIRFVSAIDGEAAPEAVGENASPKLIGHAIEIELRLVAAAVVGLVGQLAARRSLT